MNWHGQLAHSLWTLRGIPISTYLREYRRLSHLSPAVCRSDQEDRLHRIVDYARRYVPYYQRHIHNRSDAGTHPRATLAGLPILTKSLLRRHFLDLQTTEQHKRRVYRNSSGGSTGEPVSFLHDNVYSFRNKASVLFFEELLGQELGQRKVWVWGSERDLLQGSVGWRATLGQWLINSSYLNAFRMSPERMRFYLRELNRDQPNIIVAYAQAIYELASFARREGISVLPQRAIVTSAGTLYSFMRELLEEVFQCPGRIFNRYGSREVGLIASELPGHQGLIVNFTENYVEVVNEDGEPAPPGVEGRILVTNLHNMTMPLLRYDIGDRGTLAAEDAASGAQCLIRVCGRSADAFRTRTRGSIGGEYFTHMLKAYPWLRQFQIVQPNYDWLHFKLVIDGDVPKADWDEIVHITRVVMGETVRIDRSILKEVDPGPSGKYRYTICEIPE